MIVCVVLKERKILEETVAPLTPSSPVLSSPCYKDPAYAQNSIVRDWECKQVQLEKQMVRKNEEMYSVHGGNWKRGKMSGGCIGDWMGGFVERCMYGQYIFGGGEVCRRIHWRMDILYKVWALNWGCLEERIGSAWDGHHETTHKSLHEHVTH